MWNLVSNATLHLAFPPKESQFIAVHGHWPMLTPFHRTTNLAAKGPLLLTIQITSHRHIGHIRRTFRSHPTDIQITSHRHSDALRYGDWEGCCFQLSWYHWLLIDDAFYMNTPTSVSFHFRGLWGSTVDSSLHRLEFQSHLWPVCAEFACSPHSMWTVDMQLLSIRGPQSAGCDPWKGEETWAGRCKMICSVCLQKYYHIKKFHFPKGTPRHLQVSGILGLRVWEAKF